MRKYIKTKYERFNRWMHYDPPCALSSPGWDSFNDEYKSNAPIRYFIVNMLPEPYNIIKNYISRITDWIRYRTYNRYHILDSGLPPDYYEKDTLLLHTSFNVLKDFVEKEQAWSRQCWSEENKLTRKEQLPLYYELFYRKPEVGIKHFEWAATLDDPALPINERCDHQAIAAREILALYKWWTIERPHRPDLNIPDFSDQGFRSGSFDPNFDKSASDYVIFCNNCKIVDEMEETWKDEDTDMLCRLMKIRHSLWT